MVSMHLSNTSTITKLGAISFDELLRKQQIFSSPKPRFDLRDSEIHLPLRVSAVGRRLLRVAA